MQRPLYSGLSVCRTKDELLTAWAECAHDYANQVLLLESAYRTAGERLEQSRIRCLKAREAFDRHRREHGC